MEPILLALSVPLLYIENLLVWEIAADRIATNRKILVWTNRLVGLRVKLGDT